MERLNQDLAENGWKSFLTGRVDRGALLLGRRSALVTVQEILPLGQINKDEETGYSQLAYPEPEEHSNGEGRGQRPKGLQIALSEWAP